MVFINMLWNYEGRKPFFSDTVGRVEFKMWPSYRFCTNWKNNEGLTDGGPIDWCFCKRLKINIKKSPEENLFLSKTSRSTIYIMKKNMKDSSKGYIRNSFNLEMPVDFCRYYIRYTSRNTRHIWGKSFESTSNFWDIRKIFTRNYSL